MASTPTHEKPDIDPDGVLAHLIKDITVYGQRMLSAEQLLIQLLVEAIEKGANADDVAAQLGLSRTDAETLLAGESMLKRRLSDLRFK